MFKKIILLFTFLMLASCVGTIQDTEKQTTEATIIKPITLTFEGIIRGVAVAHNKIQLYFKPASGGSKNYSYLVFQDGNLSTPVASVSTADLALDKNGEYSIPVNNNLSIGTNYTFLVRAFDPQYNVQDSNNVQVTVKTLTYKTPIFDGVQSIENLSGKEGETSLLVKWNTATAASTGGGFGTNVDNISGYNLYVGETEEGLSFYTSVNDATATSFKLSNLDAGKTYYVRVRAKNSQTVPVEDLNVKFLTQKTFSHLPVTFGGVTALSIPASTVGFSTITVKWSPGSGNYDRYKIYARNTTTSSFNPASADYLITTISDLSVSQATINVSDPHTMWYVAVVACSDSFCTESQGQSVVKYIKTSPPVASFNGIKALAQPSGGEGLSSLDITWDVPDANTGVYDEIRVFKSDAAGNFDPFIDRVDNLAYDISYPNVMGATLKSSTYIRIQGLATGSQVCFVAMAYSTSPIDLSNPDGRTGLTRVVKCATPQYNSPGFNGVKLACTNKTAKSFKVSWDLPTPAGTYEDFEVYYKQATSSFVMADAFSGAAGYQKVVELPTSTGVTLSNLLMNTNYQILVKTHFHNNVDGVDYRDNNSIIANCATGSPLIEQGPWFELFAIGPKFDGLKGIPVAEKLTPLEGGIDGKSNISIGKTEWKHQYPVESSGTSLGVEESINGIIRISWEDMLLSDDLGHLKDYSNIPNTGYKVYRVKHNALYGTSGPSYNDATAWGNAINTGYVQAPVSDINVYFRSSSSPVVKSIAQYVDYSLIHPYDADISRANEATIYWYKIEPWYNGKKLTFSSISADAVVKMVLPPKNMAYVHRWMSNKQFCEDMGLNFLRSNNYKCEYNGLGAVEDSNDGVWYYDMKGDLLVDRFEMGCNFSRGNSIYKCTDGGYTGFEGIANSKGAMDGDCIGKNSSTSNPTGRLSAKAGAIFYNRATNLCYINTSTSVGTTWKTLNDADGMPNTGIYGYSDVTNSTTKPINAANTKMPPTYGTDVSDSVPVVINNHIFGDFPKGLGYGAKVYSNNANLPVIQAVDLGTLHFSCQSHVVTVNGNVYLKKLSRRKEFIMYSADSPLINTTDRTNLYRGLSQLTYDTSTVAPIKNYLTMTLAEHNDRDCNSSGIPNNTNTFYYNPANGIMYRNSDFTNSAGYFNVPKIKGGTIAGQVSTGTELDFSDPRWSTGGNTKSAGLLTTGSSGPLSSEACTSRYGVQDFIGNAAEYTNDLLYCNSDYGCSIKYKDQARTIPFVSPYDSENQEIYKNPNGVYFNVTDATTSGTLTSSMGTRLVGKNSYFNSSSIYSTDFFCWANGGTSASTTGACGSDIAYPSAKYFNLALGIPMNCEGSTCTYLGVQDSNSFVTNRTNPPSSTTMITSFSASALWSQIAGSQYTAPAYVGFMNGGNNIGSYNDRYGQQLNETWPNINSGNTGASVSGRCDVLLPEEY